MGAESLRAELTALAGVAEADVDETAGSPSGVRVRLEPDADARLVGAEVQRVLAAHGLRSRITDRADGSVVADEEPVAEAGVAEPEAPPMPEVPPMPAIPPQPSTPPPVVEEAPVIEPVAEEEFFEEPEAAEPEPSERHIPATHSAATVLEGVAIEERADKVVVTARAAGGRTASAEAPVTPEGVDEAIVTAIAELAGEDAEVLSVTPIEANGAMAYTVVVRRADGTMGAGAAIQRLTAGYAVGKAAWTAIYGD